MIWMLATSSSSNGFEPFEVDAAEHFVAEHDRHRELGAHVDRHRRRDVARILAHVVDDLHLAGRHGRAGDALGDGHAERLLENVL